MAAIALDTATLNTLKTAQKWVFGVMVFGSTKTTAIPISLKGLPAAIAHVTKK